MGLLRKLSGEDALLMDMVSRLSSLTIWFVCSWIVSIFSSLLSSSVTTLKHHFVELDYQASAGTAYYSLVIWIRCVLIVDRFRGSYLQDNAALQQLEQGTFLSQAIFGGKKSAETAQDGFEAVHRHFAVITFRWRHDWHY